MWTLLEPIHVVTYFSPEPQAALRAAGYRGYWMGYFAQRSAPLGAASPELVQALFYNFSADHIARALPDAWAIAPPEAALAARVTGSAAALARLAAAGDVRTDLTEAAEIASEIAQNAPTDGRGLFAAHLSVPEPTDPLARLWHAATLLREHRGDGHVTSLLAHGIGGRESHVFHALKHHMPAEGYELSRNLSAEEWAEHLDALRVRGLVDDDGSLSDDGQEMKQSIEDLTDILAESAYSGITEADAEHLDALITPLRHAIVASGELPNPTPTGMVL
jgi:hypothetical protein